MSDDHSNKGNTFTLDLSGLEEAAATPPAETIPQMSDAGFGSNVAPLEPTGTFTATDLDADTMAMSEPSLQAAVGADEIIEEAASERTAEREPEEPTSYPVTQGEAFQVARTGRVKTVIAAGLLGGVCVLSYVAFEAMDEGKDPVSAIFSAVGLSGVGDFLGLEGDRLEPEIRAPNPALQLAKQRAMEKEKAKRKAGVAPKNPYWELPNEVPARLDPNVREWSAEEKIIWLDGISSPFVYQHYRTLLEVRRYQLRGSEEILWQGVRDKKFWTRMSAVMGLAEFGFDVDIDVVEQAIGNARPTLVANYFKRFRLQSTPGERYVLRQAVKVVDTQARRNILTALANSDDPLRDVYLVAGLFDPGTGQKEFSEQRLSQLKVKKETVGTLKNYILGLEELPKAIQAQVVKLPETINARKLDQVETVDAIEFFGEDVPVDEEEKSDSANGGADGAGEIEVIEIKNEDIL